MKVDRVFTFKVQEMMYAKKTVKLEIQYRYEPKNLKHIDIKQVERVKSVVFRPQGSSSSQ